MSTESVQVYECDADGMVLTGAAYTYDESGRVLTAAWSHGTYTYAYDIEDRLTTQSYIDADGANGRHETYTYEGDEQTVFVVDLDGELRRVGIATYTRDSDGRVRTRAWDLSGDGRVEERRAYEYNGDGNVSTSALDWDGDGPSGTFSTWYDYSYSCCTPTSYERPFDAQWGWYHAFFSSY